MIVWAGAVRPKTGKNLKEVKCEVWTDIQIDGWTDGRTDGWTDRSTKWGVESLSMRLIGRPRAWSAVPIALLCMVVNRNERQGSGFEGNKVLKNTGDLHWFYTDINQPSKDRHALS